MKKCLVQLAWNPFFGWFRVYPNILKPFFSTWAPVWKMSRRGMMLREMVLIYLIGQGQEHTSLARKNKTVNFTLWPIFQKNFSDRPCFEFQKYLVIIIIIIKYYNNKAFFGTTSVFFSVQTVLQMMMMTLMMRMMH